MPIPIIPIISALASGGTLVPHAAGGMIVTSSSGYVTGTLISTSAIGTLFASSITVLSAGILYVTGIAGAIIGSAGYFGTTVGATGIKGFLMSIGVISSTPIWLPLVVFFGILAGLFKVWGIKKKISNASEDEEVMFTEKEAKLVEKLIKFIGGKGKFSKSIRKLIKRCRCKL